MQAYKVSHNGLKSFLKSHFLISKFSYIFKTNVFPKGQKQLKMIFSGRRFLQKMNERVLLYYYETSGWLIFIHFLEEIEDTKRTFWNHLTFRFSILPYHEFFIPLRWYLKVGFFQKNERNICLSFCRAELASILIVFFWKKWDQGDLLPRFSDLYSLFLLLLSGNSSHLF